MKKFLIFLLSVFLLSGCVKKVKDPNFTVEDSGIYDTLEFVDMVKRTKEDGFLEIQAVFKNYTNSNETVAYKVDYVKMESRRSRSQAKFCFKGSCAVD